MSNEVARIVFALIFAYLLGSIPTAYIFGRFRKGVDIREVGTRNMGAMNSIYTLGLTWGILVLLIDVAKGALAILLAGWLRAPFIFQLAAGGIAVVGHILPVFLRFRGGKGGAVCIGVFIALMPWIVPIGGAIFLVLLLLTRFPTLSYSIALCCAPFIAWLVYNSGALVIFTVIMLLFLLTRYMPRVFEMRSKAGSWQKVFLRKNLKDRF